MNLPGGTEYWVLTYSELRNRKEPDYFLFADHTRRNYLEPAVVSVMEIFHQLTQRWRQAGQSGSRNSNSTLNS